MEYVGRFATQSMIQGEQTEANLLGGLTRAEHRQSIERRNAIFFWLESLLILVVILIVYVYHQIQTLERLYSKEFRWWNKGNYTKGPRAKGTSHQDLLCVCLAAEFPQFASLVCSTLHQTSAIFILTMIQHFSKDLKAIHYSGSREQLNGDQLHKFIKDYDGWKKPENPWQFLFPTKSSFARSVAIQDAKSRSAFSILETLYDGGLCKVAIDFYKPDIGPEEMIHMLLDEQLVYQQECGASKLATAEQLGSSIGAAATMVTGFGRKAMVNGVKNKFGNFLARATTRGARAVWAAGPAEEIEMVDLAGAASEGAEVAETAAALSEAEVAAAACGPFWFACAAVAAIVVTGIAVGIGVATTAASTAVINGILPCDEGNFYRLVRLPNGTFVKVEWDGKTEDLVE